MDQCDLSLLCISGQLVGVTVVETSRGLLGSSVPGRSRAGCPDHTAERDAA